jgi:hypothetical protein
MKMRCNECVNELDGKCLIKKTTVNINKPRRCSYYEFDQARDIIRLEHKAMLIDRQNAITKAKQMITEAHPSTGDLSRFKTTAT